MLMIIYTKQWRAGHDRQEALLRWGAIEGCHSRKALLHRRSRSLLVVHLEIQSHLLPLASLLPFLEHDKGSTTHMTTPCALACQLLEPRRNL